MLLFEGIVRKDVMCVNVWEMSVLLSGMPPDINLLPVNLLPMNLSRDSAYLLAGNVRLNLKFLIDPSRYNNVK